MLHVNVSSQRSTQAIIHSSRYSQVVHTLQECMAIDESICTFQGYIHFHVYMIGKTHKYGLKREVGTFNSWKHMLAHTPQKQTTTAPSVLQTDPINQQKIRDIQYIWIYGSQAPYCLTICTL